MRILQENPDCIKHEHQDKIMLSDQQGHLGNTKLAQDLKSLVKLFFVWVCIWIKIVLQWIVDRKFQEPFDDKGKK